MTESEFDGLKRQLFERPKFGYADSFVFAKACSRLLGRAETEAWGRELTVRVLEVLPKMHSSTRPIWSDVVEAAGFYPYLLPQNVTGGAALRYEYHRSRTREDVYFHREQVEVANLLETGNSVVLSAPTSFGKSLLIQELVLSEQYKNIVIIQPTLALLDETRKKLQELEINYRLIVTTTQSPSDDANIFLFTGERVVEYKHFRKVDFFVIDEFYKLSLNRDDERAISLNQALYRLLKLTNRFYMLGPSVRSVSDQLAEKTSAKWVHSDFATVAVDVQGVVPKTRKTNRRLTPKKKREFEKEAELYELLGNLTDSTLIYCSSPQKASRLAEGFAKWRDASASRVRDESIREMIGWIDQNIHDQWALRDVLLSSTAYHHGAIPRHLGSSIVDGFNQRAIRYLFCTSTLIEGVNTVARNVVLFDDLKGKKPIDYFDYKNIVGRSGRMRVHYVGQVFQFARRPDQMELDVDIPLFAQDTAPLELLVQLDAGDLDSSGKARVEEAFSAEPSLRELIKSNAGIWVEGQIDLVREIRSNLDKYSRILAWNTVPRYPELAGALGLCYQYLVKPHESKGNVSPGQLAVLTIQYVMTRSLKSVIEQSIASDYWRGQIPDEFERIQKMVHMVLNTSRQWFEYRLPKVLTALSNIQQYVFSKEGLKAGNYSFLASQLENSLLKGSLSVLLDYDVPLSAIRKIEGAFRGDESWPDIVTRLNRLDFEQAGLLPYEKRKLSRLK